MKKVLYYLCFILIGIIIILCIFSKIFFSNSVIFPFAIYPFDIAKKYSEIWHMLKIIYMAFYVITLFIIARTMKIQFLSKKIFSEEDVIISIEEDNFKVLIGENDRKEKVYIEEKGLYQNILVTGTIGSGKTSSALYPITRQIMGYKTEKAKEKMAMLILDVKGNYYKQVLKFAKDAGRRQDVVIIEVGGNYKYNPLDKPEINSQVLANRLKTILELFNSNNTESYWLDKAEQILTESIKFCRLYNKRICEFYRNS